jgi:hypothetical protein
MMGFQQFHLGGSSKNYSVCAHVHSELNFKRCCFQSSKDIGYFHFNKNIERNANILFNFYSKKRLSVEGIEKRKKKVSEFLK